jgi:(1->4)-alpha-D-glucan 1-alpha-D-glucosylmutase
MVNPLAQVTLKAGSPGVPDFYQGTELWELSLVDPDNRRPVDFERRSHLLREVDVLLGLDPVERAGLVAEWMRDWQDGRIKLLVTAVGLRLRRDLPRVFCGGYLPLVTEVTVPGAAIVFARTAPPSDATSDVVIFAAPRLCRALVDGRSAAPVGGDVWKTSRIMLPPALADRVFRHEITGAEIRPTRAGDSAWIFLGEAFQHVPVAILRAV